MAKNYYFENYENSMEQSLIEDLVVESIKIFGIDCFYIPRIKPITKATPRQAAALTCSIDNGAVDEVSFLSDQHGYGYLATPTVTFSDAPEGGTTATGTATIVRGVVTTITIDNSGSGYVTAPTVTIQSPADTNVGQPAYIASGYDDLLNEDDLPVYNTAFELEMYVKNVDGFEGEGDFLSKFGLQIRDSMTLTVAMRTWEQEIGLIEDVERVRPFEGDLIYFPLNKKIFQIMHVEHEAIFYQMGSLQTYDVKCELFEYSNERFTTGIPAVDDLYEKYKTVNTGELSGLDTPIDIVTQDVGENADNFVIENTGDNILDFSEGNPFGETNW
jgi:hypothetical protein